MREWGAKGALAAAWLSAAIAAVLLALNWQQDHVRDAVGVAAVAAVVFFGHVLAAEIRHPGKSGWLP